MGSVGVPVFPVVYKDLSVPFPCQDCSCGCSNATQCWDNCCCMTDAEKIAWAKANQVQPPDWFLERVKETAEDAVHHPETSCPAACCGCGGGGSKSCGCQARKTSCCSGCTPKTPAERPESQGGLRFVWIQAQNQCTGGQLDFAKLILNAWLFATEDGWAFQQEVVDAIYQSPIRVVSRDETPPTPPPQFSRCV